MQKTAGLEYDVTGEGEPAILPPDLLPIRQITG
jgi:hypothetical protein